MESPEHTTLAGQIERLSRSCSDPLVSAALDVGLATLRGDPTAQRASLSCLLALAAEQIPPADDRVAHAALACGAGALRRDGFVVAAGTRLLIQHQALSTADLLETAGLRLELEAATSKDDRIAQVAAQVQAAHVRYGNVELDEDSA